MSGSEPDFWHGKRVLVTGATGFLGGFLVRDLTVLGARVTALVRRPRPQSQLYLAGLAPRIEIVTGDVWDGALLERMFEGEPIDAVFHTAMWGGGVEATLEAPVECLRSTTESTWLLLDILRRKAPGTTMIVCSSDKAYGTQPTPYRETAALRPGHPQEVAKAAQDLLTQSFGKVYGLKVAVTRCGNFFGPYDFNYTRIIPYVARQAARGEVPELRSDGSFVRDFLAVEEASQAHLLLARAVCQNPELNGEVFNFSHEVRLSVMDIVRRILAIAGSDLEPRIVNTVRHEIASMWLACDKARAVLGWKPDADFDTSLARTVRWYLDWEAQAATAPARAPTP